MKPLLCSLLAAITLGSASADYTVTPSPTDQRGLWKGFGTSLAWFANGVGQSSYQNLYADLLFTTKTQTVLGSQVPGLGLSLARYNIGGCGQGDVINGAVEHQPDPSVLPWYRAIHGFWLNWFSSDPTSSSWDWTRDANQRAMMLAASARGAHIEMFANAPEWWMTVEKSSCGGQLQAWNQHDFATYLATVVKKAKTDWNVTVDSVEAFNEPAAGWWTYPKNQEGCNIVPPVQATILGYLRQELNARGLQGVSIAASDENAMSQGVSTLNYLKTHTTTVNGTQTVAANLIDTVDVHSYNGLDAWTDNSVRTALHQAAGTKTVSASEFGDPDGGGMTLAQMISCDINVLRARSWHYWQVIEPSSGWGLVNAQYDAPADQTSTSRGAPKWVYTKYYTFAQFTRFLRPGMMVFGTNDINTVLAYDNQAHTLTFITVNYGTAQNIVYDLTQIAKKGTTAVSTTTCTNSSKVFTATTRALTSGKLTIPADANSVTSTVIPGVTFSLAPEP